MSFAPLLFTVAALAAANPDASRLAVIRTPSDFTLTNQDNKPFRLSQLRGEVVLVSFIFTTCNGTCPATTHRMSQVAQALGGQKAHLVSITLDPKRDTPAVLREYMRLYDVDPKRWTFLTGTPKEIDGVLSDWGMWVRHTSGGSLDHPSRVFLLDRRGRLREIYNLDFFRPEWVREDLKLLLEEVSDASQERPDASAKRR
jgi:protein SCO1/2